MNRTTIDDTFRNTSSDARVAIPAHLWERMDRQLSKEESQPSKRSIIHRMLMPIAASLLIGIIYLAKPDRYATSITDLDNNVEEKFSYELITSLSKLDAYSSSATSFLNG